MFPEKIKRAIGLGRCVKMRELIGGNRIYNEAFDQHKTIFVHIPKSAGTSVGSVLFPGHRTTHYSWEYYQSYCPRRFAEYYKFTFVRNPFDRVVSAYFYLQQGGQSTTAKDRKFRDRYIRQYESFQDFIRQGLHRPEIRRWGHFVPQSKFVATDAGRIQVDFVGRVEQMATDFPQIAQRLGIEGQLVHVNTSARKHFSEYYDELTEQIVCNHYRDDFRLFGYPETVEQSLAG